MCSFPRMAQRNLGERGLCVMIHYSENEQGGVPQDYLLYLFSRFWKRLSGSFFVCPAKHQKQSIQQKQLVCFPSALG